MKYIGQLIIWLVSIISILAICNAAFNTPTTQSASQTDTDVAFNRMSWDDHLQQAKAASDPTVAIQHLNAIPQYAPQYKEAETLKTAALLKMPVKTYGPDTSKLRRDDTYDTHFWGTTLQVDTNMDSFWLDGEKRRCSTSPDDTGRVTEVWCDGTKETHGIHNIPVKFYGAIDTNRISNWTCTREGDSFTCKSKEKE